MFNRSKVLTESKVGGQISERPGQPRSRHLTVINL